METDEEAKETETKEKETKKEEVTPQVKKELVSCSFILWFYLVPQKYLHSQHLHARGIFADRGAYVPTQEKKKNICMREAPGSLLGFSMSPLSPRHFRRWGGLCAHTTNKKKKKKNTFMAVRE